MKHAEYERARRLERHIFALRTLPDRVPAIVRRYWRVMERAGGIDPLTVPIARRLDEYQAGKDIPF